jgi:hypothetical protein
MSFMLSFTIKSIMLIVVWLNVVMLSVVAPFKPPTPFHCGNKKYNFFLLLATPTKLFLELTQSLVMII